MTIASPSPLIDPLARRITYLRLSVTDRCDFRCAYCMAEEMTFMPKAELLTLDELDRVASAFIRRGVRKLRLTGGEPLVRRNVMELVRNLGRHLATDALDELTLSTNGSQLARFADDLRAAGVRRVNVSLDTLDPARFSTLTRRGELGPVMDGLRAAREAGLAVKINTVALKGVNEDELENLMIWAHSQGFAITFIETMPMGPIDSDRTDQYLPLTTVRARLERRFNFDIADHRSGGPARYVRVSETGGLLGFITPLSNHFCDDCNRVRLTCTGKLYLCLGQEDAADLREPLRAGADDNAFDAVLDAAIARKPRGHDFIIDGDGSRGAMPRHMSVTGG